MATERTIICEDCGHEDRTFSTIAKRCYVCRLFRNLTFMKGRMAKCWACEEPFCPIARDDQLCANCAYLPKANHEIECAFCGESKTSVAKDIRVCAWCAREKNNRKRFYQAVLKKRDGRAAEVV